jgi:hypothetical protein
MDIRPAGKHFVPLLGVVAGAGAVLFDLQHGVGLAVLCACTAVGVAGWLYEVVSLVAQLSPANRRRGIVSVLFDGSMIELACWALWFFALSLLVATLCTAQSYFWAAALGHADAHWHMPHYSGVHSSLAALLNLGNAVAIAVLESGFAHMTRPVSVSAETLVVPVLLASALLELLVAPVAVARFTQRRPDAAAPMRYHTLPPFTGVSPLLVTVLYVFVTYGGLSALLATVHWLVASTCVLLVASAAFGVYCFVVVYGRLWSGYVRQRGRGAYPVRDGHSLVDTVYEWLAALFGAYTMLYALAVGVHVALVQCEMLARPAATHSVLFSEMPLHGDQAYVRTLRCAYYIVFAFVSGGHGRYEPAHAISASVLTVVVLVLRAVRIGVLATGVEALLRLAAAEGGAGAKADDGGDGRRRDDSAVAVAAAAASRTPAPRPGATQAEAAAADALLAASRLAIEYDDQRHRLSREEAAQLAAAVARADSAARAAVLALRDEAAAAQRSDRLVRLEEV